MLGLFCSIKNHSYITYNLLQIHCSFWTLHFYFWITCSNRKLRNSFLFYNIEFRIASSLWKGEILGILDSSRSFRNLWLFNEWNKLVFGYEFRKDMICWHFARQSHDVFLDGCTLQSCRKTSLSCWRRNSNLWKTSIVFALKLVCSFNFFMASYGYLIETHWITLLFSRFIASMSAWLNIFFRIISLVRKTVYSFTDMSQESYYCWCTIFCWLAFRTRQLGILDIGLSHFGFTIY